MARPEKITYDLIEAICENVALGFSYDQAALNNGISASKFFRWMVKGKEPAAEKIYVDFVKAIEEASDFSEAEALQLVRSAAKVDRNWKASAWFLERRFPEKYGKRPVHSSNQEGSVND